MTGKRRLGLGILVVAVLLPLLLSLLFPGGPRFPRAEHLLVEPPVVGVDVPKFRERRPVLLTLHEGAVSATFSYDPRGGGGRDRELIRPIYRGAYPWNPAASPGYDYWPKPGLLRGLLRRIGLVGEEAPPAAVLSASPEEGWYPGMNCLLNESLYRLGSRSYLLGRSASGRPVPLPLLVDPALEAEVPYRGIMSTTADLRKSLGPDGALTLRITREAEEIHYRFGGRDHVRTPDAVLTTTGTKLLPDLVESLALREDRPQLLVSLELGTGVRYVDVVRAVECARGDPGVLFLPWPRRTPRGSLSLPKPDRPRPEVRDLSAPLFVATMLFQGRVTVREETVSTGTLLDLLVRRRARVLVLRADHRAPWKACRALLAAAREEGLEIGLALAPPDPNLPFEQWLPLSGRPLPAASDAALDTILPDLW